MITNYVRYFYAKKHRHKPKYMAKKDLISNTKLVKQRFPYTKIIINRFHIVNLLSRALNKN